MEEQEEKGTKGPMLQMRWKIHTLTSAHHAMPIDSMCAERVREGARERDKCCRVKAENQFET